MGFIILASLAHKYARPTHLAPMWSLVIIVSVIQNLLNLNNESFIVISIGGVLALIAVLFPVIIRITTDDPTLHPQNRLHLIKRFSSF